MYRTIRTTPARRLTSSTHQFRSHKPTVIAHFQGGCVRVKKAVSRRFSESTEKELENSEAVKILRKSDFSALKRSLPFLRCANSTQTNDLIIHGGIISKRQPGL